MTDRRNKVQILKQSITCSFVCLFVLKYKFAWPDAQYNLLLMDMFERSISILWRMRKKSVSQAAFKFSYDMQWNQLISILNGLERDFDVNTKALHICTSIHRVSQSVAYDFCSFFVVVDKFSQNWSTLNPMQILKSLSSSFIFIWILSCSLYFSNASFFVYSLLSSRKTERTNRRKCLKGIYLWKWV